MSLEDLSVEKVKGRVSGHQTNMEKNIAEDKDGITSNPDYADAVKHNDEVVMKMQKSLLAMAEFNEGIKTKAEAMPIVEEAMEAFKAAEENFPKVPEAQKTIAGHIHSRVVNYYEQMKDK